MKAFRKKRKKWTGKWDGDSFRVKKLGITDSFFGDVYHSLLAAKWSTFVFLFFVGYTLINGFFASLYFFSGENLINVDPNSYWEAFVFSFQTSAGIGYGKFLPKTNLAHAIVLFDSLSGMLFVALATGLAFGKFSRPSAMVMFSHNILVNKRNGRNTLLFRLANSRDSQIVDANIKVSITINEVTEEGDRMRRPYDLNLIRSDSPLFALSWTVMHEIDETSPLNKLTKEQMQSEETVFIITLHGIDDVFSQMVYARHAYFGSNLIFDRYFEDVMGVDSREDSYVDYSKFNKLKPEINDEKNS
jgi:inward rectifier potassium channel